MSLLNRIFNGNRDSDLEMLETAVCCYGARKFCADGMLGLLGLDEELRSYHARHVNPINQDITESRQVTYIDGICLWIDSSMRPNQSK